MNRSNDLPDPRADAPAPLADPGAEAAAAERETDLLDFVLPLAARWRSLVAVPVAATLIAYGATYLVTPVFTGTTTFLPPQQQQGMAASALSSLGALASLAGGGMIKSPAEQYIALMQSNDVADRMIDRFKLTTEYDVKFREDARKGLAKRSNFNLGKKDGLIRIDVDDTDPKRAAAMANAYVDELRRLTSRLAISEAQQRRAFFEVQLQQTKDRLVAAQAALQQSGISQGALKAEPRAAAEAYASLRALLTTAQVQLQMMRSSLSDSNPQVIAQQAKVQALQAKSDALEESAAGGAQQADYIGRYREFKYQETLFEQMARQYELARIDEAREGALIQVVDPAQPPERRSRPKRTMIAVGVGAATAVLYALLLVVRIHGRGVLAQRAAARAAAQRTAARRP